MALGFGVDIGGSGIKGAPVDLDLGDLTTGRHRIPTPQPAKPDAVAGVVADVVSHFGWKGPLGVTFPGIVKRGVIHSAANVDDDWLDVDADALFTARCGQEVHVANDADAAGIAEMRVGAGKGRTGVVMTLTFGTGIGSGMFVDGVLVPNTELGHVEMHGDIAERYAAGRVLDDEGLSFDEWGQRVRAYLQYLERLFSPDLFIIGGGISKDFAEYEHQLDIDTEVVPARLRNAAGIVGAAMLIAAEAG